jgi:hypothetical protein
MEKIIKGWKKSQSGELQSLLYALPNMKLIKPRRMRLYGYATEMRNAYNILVWKPEGKNKLGES